MLSRNLVKRMYVAPSEEEETRMIDTNVLVENRLAELVKQKGAVGTDGFVAGLNAERIEVLPEGEASQGAQETGAGSAAVLEHASEEARKILENAAVEAQAKITDAQVEAARIRKEAQQQAGEEKIQILEQAKRQGYEEGYESAQAEAEKIRQEYARREQQLEAHYQQQIDELEPQFIDAITDIYEHILGVDLGSQREILAHLISSTIRKIEGSHSFIIHVSKEDYPFVSMQKKQLLAGAAAGSSTVEVVEDITMGQSECTIETDGGIFDCGLGTQLSELKKRLMLLAYSREESS
ncbi:MAG: FliH/SctL family protein [Eubacterium sp.]|nr:FliH/SctL family protein [Eubacterium sp.]